MYWLKDTLLRLFYCDETNLEERGGDFLIYGGLMIEAEAAHTLSLEIDMLRVSHGVPADYRLKFNPGPEGFSHRQFIALKEAILLAARDHGAQLLVYLILHDIATSPDEARRNGINTVCYHFHSALGQVDGTGLVLIDRFNDEGNAIEAHLRDKFSTGITGLPYSGTVRLDRIVGFHYSAIGQSHLPSVVDVALGSLRFALNAHTRGQTQHEATAQQLLSLLSPLFWRSVAGDPVPELGLQFSPKVVRSARYRGQYEAAKWFLEAGGVPSFQEITGGG